MADLFPTETNGQALRVVEAQTPMALISTLIERGTDISQMQALFDLQKDYERNEAAKAYAQALTTFQAKCPPIVKGRQAGEDGFGFTYAAYEDLWAVAGPLCAELGMAISYSTQPHEKGILGTIFVRKGIHEEARTMFVPIPSMRVNDTQKYGAAVAYVKRYLLQAALNIITTGEDNDASAMCEPITEEQSIRIKEWLVEKKVNEKRFLEWAGVDQIKDMPADKYQQALEYLRRK